MPDLRVATYNVYGLRHAAALAGVIADLRPDVLVVNESPKLPLLWRWQCARAARRWGLRLAAGGRSAGSNMICVSDRVRVDRTLARRLRQPWFKPRRGIVGIQASVDGAAFGVLGAHLSLLPASRPVEVAELLSEIERLEGPVVLAGDLNENPGQQSWRRFAAAGLADHAQRDAFTYPAVGAHKRIDALLVRGAEVRDHRVPLDIADEDRLGRASDHRPVVADLHWSV